MQEVEIKDLLLLLYKNMQYAYLLVQKVQQNSIAHSIDFSFDIWYIFRWTYICNNVHTASSFSWTYICNNVHTFQNWSIFYYYMFIMLGSLFKNI